MARENKTRYALMGILSFSPMSGYDIKRIIDSSVAYFWTENYGHIYPILKRLEAEGFVTKEIQQEGNRPPKKVYALTPKGNDELRNWLILPIDDREMVYRDELLLKLFFGFLSGPRANIELLETQYRKQERFLAEMDANLRQIDEGEGSPLMKTLWRITVEAGKSWGEAQQKWCRQSIEIIRNYLERYESE